MHKTKIVITLGSSTDSPEMIETLIRIGVKASQVYPDNFSYTFERKGEKFIEFLK